MKALVGAFNQEKALVGAFSVIVKTSCGTDGALHSNTWNVVWWLWTMAAYLVRLHICDPADVAPNLDHTFTNQDSKPITLLQYSNSNFMHGEWFLPTFLPFCNTITYCILQCYFHCYIWCFVTVYEWSQKPEPPVLHIRHHCGWVKCSQQFYTTPS